MTVYNCSKHLIRLRYAKTNRNTHKITTNQYFTELNMKFMNTRAFSPLFALFLIVFAANTQAIEEGYPVPNFDLPALANAGSESSIKLSDYRGKIVYIDFWASWCGPCRKSLPDLNEIRAKYADKDFEVIAINLDKDKADALKFLEKYPVDYPIAADPSSKIAEQYELKGMPNAFLIDKKGTLKHFHAGYKAKDKEKIDAMIAQLLGE